MFYTLKQFIHLFSFLIVSKFSNEDWNNENNENNDKSEDSSLVDQIVNEIIASEKTDTEEKPTEPVNFPVTDKTVPDEQPVSNEPNSENEDKNEDVPLTLEELEQLDSAFSDLEKNNEELTTKNTELTTDIEKLNTELNEWKEKFDKETETKTLYEQALEKLWEHPILWPLNEKLLKWEELNIPDILMKSLESDINAIPDLNWTEPIHKPQKPTLTPQEKIEQAAKNRY